MEQVTLDCLAHNGATFKLQKSISISIEYSNGMWIYRNESLNLWGYGECREAALNDLYDNLAYLWTEFGLESDDRLDSKALVIKRRLQDIIVEN